MKKKLKYLAALLAVTTMFTSLSACSGGGNEAPAGTSSTDESKTSADTPPANDSEKPADASSTNEDEKPAAKQNDPTTLNIYLFGDDGAHYQNVDPAIEEFEKRTADTLNTKLNVVWTPTSEYGQMVPLWLASGEEMDLNCIWDAPKYAKDGSLVDLTEYFNNPEYPGLMKAFSEEYVNDNKLFGGSYVIPITNSFTDIEGVWYRKDFIDKYNLKDIESYDDLYDYLEVMLANETNYTPFGNYGNTAFFKLFTDPNARQLNGNVFSFTGNFNPKANYIDVQIAEDGKSVKAIAAYGDPDSEWEGFDPVYGKQFIIDQFEQCVRFNKFIPTDSLSANSGQGKEGTAGFVTLSNFQSKEASEKAKFPEAEIGFWPIFKNNFEMTPQSQSTDGKAWNFAGVYVTSNQIDRTMEFLDWIYTDQANNDLFAYGVEGVHWEAVGTNQWKVPDGVDPEKNYRFPGYQLTWNPTLNRIPAGLPDQVFKYYEYQFNPDTYKKHVLAGFTFDQEPVKNEIAKCNTVLNTYLPFLLSGFGDVNENLSAMNSDLYDSGVDKVKEELKNQINTFLSEQ